MIHQHHNVFHVFLLFLVLHVAAISTQTALAFRFCSHSRRSRSSYTGQRRPWPPLMEPAATSSGARHMVVAGNHRHHPPLVKRTILYSSSSSKDTEGTTKTKEQLKEDLRRLAERTFRGFQSSDTDREKARVIIYQLSNHYFNATQVQPARDYYDSSETKQSNDDTADSRPSLSGKWTLIYTDAPDITSLDPSLSATSSLFQIPFSLPTSPLAPAVGRIGQDNRDTPYIKNVIEWKPPKWAQAQAAENDTAAEYVLQKVVTKGRASPDRPSKVLLDLVGLELASSSDIGKDETTTTTGKDDSKDSSSWFTNLVPRLLEFRPIDLKNPLESSTSTTGTGSFGEFEILFVDEDMRIIRTGQNYYAVNCRIDTDWF